MSRVALVFPYFRTRAPTEMLFPPLGEAAIAGQLRRLGVETRIFDCTFGSLGRLCRDLASYRPTIVGIYSMVGLSRSAVSIADLVRQRWPDCLLAAGGPMPTLYPDRYAHHFDVIFRGESDLSFPRFCRDFIETRTTRDRLRELPLETYEGLRIKTRTLSVDVATVHHTEEQISSFPLPYRGDFDHARYQQAWFRKSGSKVTSLITTLGCPYSCDFCSKPIFGGMFRRRNLDGVIEEVEQTRRLGYDELWIADDSLTLNRAFLQGFCARMAGRGMRWSCLSRANEIDRETVRMMREAGCTKVFLGLESGNQETLRLMNKRITVEEAKASVRLHHDAGLEVAAFWIVGYPGESIHSIEETFALALELPLDEISFNVPFPLPGSQLFDRVSGVDENGDWRTENEVTFLYRSEFDQRWLRRRIGQTLREFTRKKGRRITPGA
jgi:anaerobic magnesium-protoporphyrin IX monomethyl ester cyclase